MKAAQGGTRRGATSPRTRGARSPSPGSGVLSTKAWTSVAKSLALSERQREILKAIFDDESEASIARRLGISPHTVHSYMQRLHHKFGVGSRAALIIRVMAEHERTPSAPGGGDDGQQGR